ncbi:MAG: efflux RND transporter permease subunit, partial [Gammaproteobacteria bacterium]|nr:efflux RND transporter permease subunit [Gammaproteobacteria bacterium]
MVTIIRFLVNRGLLVNLVSLFLLGIGIYAAFAINREAFPNVNMDRIQVDAYYPGASPKEIEQLIITPIEQELRAINGIDTMVSMSFPSSGRITMEVDPEASNRSRLTSDISLAVDRATLPTDLPADPVVTEIDGAVFPIIRLAISAPLDELALKRLGDDIKDDLLNIDGVARIFIQGDRKAELRIVVDPERMAKQRISIGAIKQALQSWNLNTPGGDLDTLEGQKTVRVVGEFSDVNDAANLVLRANERGNVLRLGDVATVTESL